MFGFVDFNKICRLLCLFLIFWKLIMSILSEFCCCFDGEVFGLFGFGDDVVCGWLGLDIREFDVLV